MGNRKQKWTSEEVEALKAGVQKHGTGKWKKIVGDPEFTTLLSSRSNMDLKDKWRNLTVRENQKTTPKENSDASVSPLTLPSTQAPPPLTIATPIQAVPLDVCVDDTSSSKVDVKRASDMAASWIADAENNTFVAAEAIQEADGVSRMLEDATAFLDFANDLFERSSLGPIVLTL